MIFTERKITVRKGKSSIDEPVILYRGDYEVELRFTITESKYRFKSGVNLVDSEKASHAQLALLAPDGTNVFTEVGRCEDGTAIFVLSKKMIDELSEVGLYSFQIRLFDYYQESRITIPPIEFGIEVREPIAAEDHINAVDDAMVGYSIAKTSVLDEPVPETFDANGQYNKTDWETGDRISEGKLNKIEDALKQINQNEMNGIAALDKRISGNFNTLNSTKANKNEVFSMANMGQDIKEAMTGGSVAVVGKNTILTTNIVDGQVTPEKTNFAMSSQPTIDANAMINGWISAEGTIDTSGSWLTTDFLKVYAGCSYTIMDKSKYFMLYDESKKAITSSYITSDKTNYTFSPTVDGYVRFSFTEITTHPSYQLRNEVRLLCNNPYISFNSPLKADFLQGSISGDSLEKGFIKPEHFGVAVVSMGDILNSGTGVIMPDGSMYNNPNYSYSEPISISGSTVYFIKYAAPELVGFFDVNMNFIDYLRTGASSILEDYTFTTPENAQYMIVNTKKEQLPTQYIYPGNTPLKNPNADNYVEIPWIKADILDSVKSDIISLIPSGGIMTSSWLNKRFVSLGDSITWQDGHAYGQGSHAGEIARGYQTIVKETLGFDSYHNAGVSGRPISNGSANGIGTNTTSKSIDYADYDLVIIAGGTNDFKLNAPLGELGMIGNSTFDTNTFYGAYRDMIEYILKQKPTIRICLFTPLQRDNGGYDVNHVNTSGHKLIDYVNAVKDIGQMYGIPVCDMYANSGITKLNLSVYTMDGLHPNDTGYIRMGGYASMFISNINP